MKSINNLTSVLVSLLVIFFFSCSKEEGSSPSSKSKTEIVVNDSSKYVVYDRESYDLDSLIIDYNGDTYKNSTDNFTVKLKASNGSYIFFDLISDNTIDTIISGQTYIYNSNNLSNTFTSNSAFSSNGNIEITIQSGTLKVEYLNGEYTFEFDISLSNGKTVEGRLKKIVDTFTNFWNTYDLISSSEFFLHSNSTKFSIQVASFNYQGSTDNSLYIFDLEFLSSSSSSTSIGTKVYFSNTQDYASSTVELCYNTSKSLANSFEAPYYYLNHPKGNKSIFSDGRIRIRFDASSHVIEVICYVFDNNKGEQITLHWEGDKDIFSSIAEGTGDINYNGITQDIHSVFYESKGQLNAAYATEVEFTSNDGYILKLDFRSSSSNEIASGTYSFANTGVQNTLGSFTRLINGSNSVYVKSGSASVTNNGSGSYTISYNLTATDDKTISGSFTGTIPLN